MNAKKLAALPQFGRALPYILIASGIVGLIASFVLSFDAMQLLKNPGYTPNCNLNPVLSCGSVLNASEGDVFGFPNPWIGFVTFTIFVTVGVMLLAGAQLKRWFWLAFYGGTTLGIIFAYWMLFRSIYFIQGLCPYCLSVDVVLTTAWWYLTLYIIEAGHVRLPKQFTQLGTFARKHHAEILVTWFLIIIAIILQHFWYYYGQFI